MGSLSNGLGAGWFFPVVAALRKKLSIIFHPWSQMLPLHRRSLSCLTGTSHCGNIRP
jgi:hypothetical protein